MVRKKSGWSGANGLIFDDDRFYIVLFSALCCALDTWDSYWVLLFIVFWISTEVYLQHCLVVSWLAPCEAAAVLAHMFCTLCSHVTLFHPKPHRQDACMFSCNLRLCGTTGVEQILKWESAQKVDHGERNAGTQTYGPSVTSLALYWAILLPK